MSLKLVTILFVILTTLTSPFLLSPFGVEEAEEGMLSVFFMDEKVGYEEYVWNSDERGYSLQVKGRMMKPVELEIENLFLRLDKSFIPSEFYFKGAFGGVAQEIVVTILDGQVAGDMWIGEQKSRVEARIRRDGFLLPIAIFSPYIVITKKFRCSLEEKVELSAYIIPQLEMSFTLESKEGAPCRFLLNMEGKAVELESDETGSLKSLVVPSQKIKVSGKVFTESSRKRPTVCP